MSLDKKLESLIEVGEICEKQVKDYYVKIQEHYNLTDIEMKIKWINYQLEYYNSKTENLGDA